MTMLKDRAQKASVLRLCLSKRWLPQLEVEVEPARSIDRNRTLLTDVDVLAVAPTAIGGHGRIAFDCKSGLNESAMAQAFWLHGVMARLSISHGFVVLSDKVAIERDHRMSAADLGVSLLHEGELQSLAKGLGGSVAAGGGATESIDAWDRYFEIGAKYPKLSEYTRFARSSYWMIRDPGEQARKMVMRLRAIRGELDPVKPEHLAIFGDALCLFLLTLAELGTRLFLLLLQSASREEFSAAVMSLLYGGTDNVETAQKLRKLAGGADADAAQSIFPEIDKFEHLVRELLEAPRQALTAAMLARELGFSFLMGSGENRYQQELQMEAPYASKFILVASEYLRRAARLPPEFASLFSDRALNLQIVAMVGEGQGAASSGAR